MAAGHRDGGDRLLAQLVGELAQLVGLQPTDVGRDVDGVEKRRRALPGHAITILLRAAHARRATTKFAACRSRSAASPNGSRCAAGLSRQQCRPARARAPRRGSTRRSPCRPPRPCRPPCRARCGVALDVEQVVDDLEGEAEIVGIGRRARARMRLARLAEDRAGRAGEGDQRAGLEPLQARDGADRHVGACVSASRSSIWPPTMPCAPAALASSDDQRGAHGRIAVRRPRAPAPRRPAPAGRRRPGSPSPRRTACDRWACRGAGRRRPSPAGRRGSANRRARTRWRWRRAAPTIAPHLEQRGAGQHEEGAQPLAAAQAANSAWPRSRAPRRPSPPGQQAVHGALGRLGGMRQAPARTRETTTTAWTDNELSRGRRAGCRPYRRLRTRSSRPSSWPRRASARSAASAARRARRR